MPLLTYLIFTALSRRLGEGAAGRRRISASHQVLTSTLSCRSRFLLYYFDFA